MRTEIDFIRSFRPYWQTHIKRRNEEAKPRDQQAVHSTKENGETRKKLVKHRLSQI